MDLLAAVHYEINADCTADNGVLGDLRVYLHVVEALFLVVALDDIRGRVPDVIGELTAGAEVEPFLEVLLFTGLYAGVGPAGHAGALTDDYLHPRGIGLHRIYAYGNILKVFLGHKTADDSGYVVSGDGDFHTLPETGELKDLILREVLVALYANAAHGVLAGVGIIYLYAALGPKGYPQERQNHYQN